MEQGQAFAKKYGKSISYTLDSNGVLLTKQIVDKLMPYDVYLMSSIDGDSKIHDTQRPFLHSGEGSHRVVVQNVAYALKVLGTENVAVRFTVLPSGIHRLYETFRYFYDFGFKIIDFAPNYEIEWSDGDMQTFASEIYKTASFVIKAKIDNKLINNYINWILNNNECISAYGHPCGIIPTVDTNGDIYSCHRFIDNPNFYLGNYTNFCQVIGSIRSLSKVYLNYWNRYGAYGKGSCPANNVCHGCHPFEFTDFFKQFISVMREQVRLALFENTQSICIKRTMNYSVDEGLNNNEHVLINMANGEYLLLNETGDVIVRILSQVETISFDELLNKFFDFINDSENIDKKQIKEDILLFLINLNKENIVSLSI
jgi:radical SAM protein with 4Fe4S-binding SPASM domain